MLALHNKNINKSNIISTDNQRNSTIHVQTIKK